MSRGGRDLPDLEARMRIVEDLDTTLFVEAAAGTGKTTALVSRIVALVRSGGGTLDRVVAVTFTEKAAGEMKLRLRTEIERARSDAGAMPEERARLEAALAQLELARIATIHAFCGDLLHERPVEAGVDPLFEVAPEDEAQALLEQAFESWLQRVLDDPPEGVRRVLRRLPRGRNAQGPRDALKSAAGSLVEHRDFPASWRRSPFDRARAIDELMGELAALGALAETTSWEDDYLARNLAEIARWTQEIAHVESVRGRDYDGLEAELRQLQYERSWRWKGSPRTRFRTLGRDEVLARRDAVKARLTEVLAQCDADLAPSLREDLRPVVEDYERLKRRAGKLDFLDLLIRARDLVRGHRGVREALQRRFTHFFIDEFQDTDPLQAELMMLLAADDPEQTDWREIAVVPGKLFIVGDPKQSIYRFRRADVAVYEQAKRLLTARGAEVLHLTTSFRALPSMQEFVNAAFAPLMRGGGQADYVALEPWRAEASERPNVIALPVPRPYTDYGKIFNWVIDDSLPDAVGAFVDWLITGSGWTVEEGGRPVGIAPRHVCILFRRFKSFNRDVTRPYVRALEARRVPHVLVGGRSFHDREEVLAVRNALVAIEWPDDELRVYATLRGPLFALGDDALLAYRHRLGSLHPMRRVELEALADSDREVAGALQVLAELHRRRNHRPIAETLSRLLGETRAHAGVAIWPTGEQALANVLRMIDIARRFERQGAPSFRAFVERLEGEAERGEAEDAPVVEEGTEGVRIMTAHKAKGLEFPVVVLADPTCRRTRDTPSRHVDPARGLWAEPLCGCAPVDLIDAADEELVRDDEESVRLAYVAATRARDLLVVPVVGDGEIQGWVDVLNPALYPPAETKHLATVAKACPQFGADSVLEWPAGARPDGGFVRPGVHRPRTGRHQIVWWDPRALALDVEERVGLRQQRILEADEDGKAARSEEAHARWQTARSQALEAGGLPSQRVTVATRAAAEFGTAVAGADEVELQHSESDRDGRPGGKRFGTLVHAALATVDFEADAAGIEAVVRAQARLIGASDPEAKAAACAVSGALANPLLLRAAACAARGDLRRETPVLLRRPDGTLVEGVVDLAFRELAQGAPLWTVVDFKTDREVEAARERYAAQVALYVEAVAAATGEPARGILLVV